MKNYKLPPKISIITPSFNQAQFIERTIKSVFQQNYFNLEYIIKDAGSTDGSLEIIKYYANHYPRIIKWISKKDKGQADGINQGIKLATGDILAYLNADDTYLPNTLEKVANYFREYPKINWVTGKCRIVDENDKEIRSWITNYKNFWLRHFRYNTLLILNYVSQPATFWRSDITKEIGFFNIAKNYTMDYDYWLRIGKNNKPGLINNELACFRIHSSSKSRSNFSKQFEEDLQTAETYSKNKFLLEIHKFSNFEIVSIYKIMSLLKLK